MNIEPQAEHRWLEQLLGEWTFTNECLTGPNEPPLKSSGRETVRSLGGLWILGEGEGEMPGGGIGRMLLTLGYDPQAKQFVGTFVASMMTHLWIYRGALDAAGKVLTLDTEGPNFTQTGLARYQDIHEIVSPTERVLRAQILGDDGQWTQFMTARYLRQG